MIVAATHPQAFLILNYIIEQEPLATGQSSKVSEVKMIEEESMDFCSSVGDQSLNESTSFIGETVNGSGDLTLSNIKKRKKVMILR